MLFHTHLQARDLCPQTYSLSLPLEWSQVTHIPASIKSGGAYKPETAVSYALSKVGKPEIVLKNKQLLLHCEGPTLTTSTYMRWKPIAFRQCDNGPRRLACFASTVNKLVASFASSSERQKRQRYFKALLHTEVVYIFRINCLLHNKL